MSANDENTENVDDKIPEEKEQIEEVKKEEKVESEEKKEELNNAENEVKQKELSKEEINKEETNKEEKEPKQEEPKKTEEEIKPKKRKKSDSKLIFSMLTILGVLIFSTIFALKNMNTTNIISGVTIKGIDVSNLTIEQATIKVTEAINKELMLGMELNYNDEYKVDFEPSQIEYSYDIYTAVKKAYELGRNGNIIKNNYEILFTKFKEKNIEIKSSYNEEFLNNVIEDVESKLPGMVTQASYYIEGDQLIITRGKPGVALKKEELKKDILDGIENRKASEISANTPKQTIQIKVINAQPDAIDVSKIYNEVYCEPQDAYYISEPFQIFPEKDGINFAISVGEAQINVDAEEKEEYTIPLILTPASKTIDDIGTEAFPYLISDFSTKYDASNTNRSGNLKIAADKINGMVLMPGEEFSFNEVVGKRTIEEGYRNAKIYENGQVVDGLAGGICQISSTLYNAVLLANLEVTERRNHSFTSTYVPAGRDATVVYGRADLKFKNTRNYPIKLEANVSSGIAEFKIHGIKEETEYEIKIIPVITQSIPYQTVYEPDPSLMPGQQVVTQYGHSGCKVTTYLEKRLGGIVVSKDAITHDTYNAMNTIVNVGQ